MMVSFRAISRAAYMVCVLGAMAALLLTGRSLWSVVAGSEGAYPVDAFATVSKPGGHREEAVRPEGVQSWPSLFGEPVAEPPVAAPPVRMPASYLLKGLVTSGDERWAILSGDGDDQLVQEGDVLTSGVGVEAIGPEGVWLRFEGLRELVAFSEAAPVRTASVAFGPEDGGAPPRRQDVRTQSLTPMELRDIILKAEADRVARGLVPQQRDEDR